MRSANFLGLDESTLGEPEGDGDRVFLDLSGGGGLLIGIYQGYKTCVSSMIPSARHTVTPVASTIIICNLFVLQDIEKWDGQTPHVKIVIPVSQPRGSI